MRRWAEAKMTHQSKQVFDRQLFEERVSIRQIVGRSRVDDDELVILECEQVVGTALVRRDHLMGEGSRQVVDDDQLSIHG